MKKKIQCSYTINWEQEVEINELDKEEFELKFKNFIAHTFTGVRYEIEDTLGDDNYSISININWEN